MHNCPWKIAFLLLLAVNLIVLLGLFLLSRPEDLPQEEETAATEKSNYEITLTKEALESALRRGLKESGSDARFSIADGFYFRIPVQAYGMKSELVLKTRPVAHEDGNRAHEIGALKFGAPSFAGGGGPFHGAGVRVHSGTQAFAGATGNRLGSQRLYAGAHGHPSGQGLGCKKSPLRI